MAKVTGDRTKTEQVVGTPPEFLRAVEKLLGEPIAFDLACNRANKVAANGYTVEDVDSLHESIPWLGPEDGLSWLNPPFKVIDPWAKKSAETFGTIAMLVPASVGTQWFWSHVRGKAHVLPVYPRIQFIGHEDPFPKDLMLCVYRPRFGLLTQHDHKQLARFMWQSGGITL